MIPHPAGLSAALRLAVDEDVEAVFRSDREFVAWLLARTTARMDGRHATIDAAAQREANDTFDPRD